MRLRAIIDIPCSSAVSIIPTAGGAITKTMTACPEKQIGIDGPAPDEHKVPYCGPGRQLLPKEHLLASGLTITYCIHSRTFIMSQNFPTP